MNKPRLPLSVEAKLPAEIVTLINRFVPKYAKPKAPSPGLQKALESLQKSPKRTAMDLYGLDDFVLK